MDFQIERNIPIPPRMYGSKSTKYAFALQMEVGDSVLVQTRPIASAISNRLKISGYKFATRKVEGGIRVWRTA